MTRDGQDDMPTRSVPEGGASGSDRVGGVNPGTPTERIDASGESGLSSSFEDRFPPGTMLAGRYRIVARLGAGGMGAVYRAEDLSLGQVVALKFLPREVTGDPVRVARLRQEVRVGREVSHPAVCRVYDIGEHHGERGVETFLTMEYIDGEDLSSLLRRIGALPREKAMQIVRQVCAGLAAAHERGVLHRDLKPANIMLDGRGSARISDFGLAALGTRVSGGAAAAGTPLYMAPEQLRGEEATPRSDIYALGLIIFELLTGARPHAGASHDEFRAIQSDAATSTERVLEHPDLDPIVARVVARCLDPDPARRPATALAVASALPGGDPLAAALAAGETPSPDMVAGAGGIGRMHPALAMLMLVVVLALPLAVAMFSARYSVASRQDLSTPPVVMRYKATEVIRAFGLERTWSQGASGYDTNAQLRWALERGDETISERVLRESTPPFVFFWYRATPSPWPEPASSGFYRGLVTSNQPARGIPGEVYVSLDLQGRVRRLFTVPPEIAIGPPRAQAWKDEDLLRACGLEPASMRETEPIMRSGLRADRHLAWEGVWPDRPEIAVRVEAGVADGRLVYLMSLSPWELEWFVTNEETRLAREEAGDAVATASARGVRVLGAILGQSLFTIVLALIATGAYIARRNLRSGRADTRGALRFAWFGGVSMLLARWFMAEELVPRTRFDVLDVFAWSVLVAVGSWSAYLAIEPVVRRRWPTALIAWTRLLSGRIMDPLVGRSVLMGVTLGVVGAALYRLGYLLPLGSDAAAKGTLGFSAMRPWVYVGGVAVAVSVQAMMGLLFVLVLVGIRRITRREWIVVLLMTMVLVLFDESRVYGTGSNAGMSSAGRMVVAMGASFVACLTLTLLYIRVGVLAAIAFIVTENVARQTPVLTDFGAWHAWQPLVPIGAIAIFGAWGFVAAVFGRASGDGSHHAQ
ncbi:MAG: serine/threonine protein kinase [Phycisphaeraceae bacterium]|nr:serine/threonine protein kinase [Phycisphaeraceae bacterium]